MRDDLDHNLSRALVMAEEAAKKGADVICLPELFRTPYFPQRDGRPDPGLAEAVPGPSTKAFSSLARRWGAVVVVPLYERCGQNFYNTAAVLDRDGRLLTPYRKTHVPHDPMFYEKSYFLPGDRGFLVYPAGFGRVSVLICYDQWFPEAARSAALLGAELILYPTAIGRIAGQAAEEGDWQEAWETVQRGHAIANGVAVAAVNRCGREGELEFWGGSFLCDAFGRVVARAGDGEEVLVAEVDLDLTETVQEGWGFLRNRRPDVYGPLLGLGQVAHLLPGPATPRKCGFHMPAEWEEHESVWLSWPHDLDSFPDLAQVEESYMAIISALSGGERVELLVRDDEMLDLVLGRLEERGLAGPGVRLHVLDYADVWFRDYGPTFLVNREMGTLAMVNWTYNAWGGKYCELLGDNKVPCAINRILNVRSFYPGMVLEGGSIEVNGRGTLLTTEQCLLNPNRNPHLKRADIELRLQEYLGIDKVIWLGEGIAGDDTDGHIDDIARFAGPRTVLCALEDDEDDQNFGPLLENLEILEASCDQDGQPLQVIRLPMPGRVGSDRRLPASYANFYIGNRAVLVPVFGDPNDRRALEIISKAFPGRRTVGIEAGALVHGLGTLHCISQQQPSV